MANITQITRELTKGLSEFSFEKAVQLSDNEAKTRMYLVEPFFEILRYNRGFENGNLVPEYNADFANLRGKKVDYAILFRNKPEVIIEVKKAGTSLNDKHLSQLNEYFNNTQDSKIGILTNGSEFKFYCRNQSGGSGLHPSPFFVFDWEMIENSRLDILAKFYSTNIDLKEIVDEAQDLFFLEGFEDAMFKEMLHPSRDFVKAIYSRMGGARLTDKTEKQIRELINSISIRNALERLQVEEAKNANSGIVTTHEELKVYHVIKTILAQHKSIETKSVGYRDYKGKFCIIIDDNQKKKVCDLYISPASQKIDIDGEKIEITDIDSIVKLRKQLINKALSFVN